VVFRSKFGLSLSLIFGLVAGEATAFPLREEITFNFKVTVTVVDHGAAFTGAKVWSMRAWEDHILLDNYGFQWRVIGEAIPIDVPSMGRIYYLKKSRGGTSTDTFGAFPLKCLQTSVTVGGLEVLADFKTPCVVRRKAPLFVTGGQSADTVKTIAITDEVDGGCESICFRSVVIERTDEPVSRGIVDELPWLSISRVGQARIGEELPRQVVGVLRPGETVYFKQDFVVE
jgi:hypothetical protein